MIRRINIQLAVDWQEELDGKRDCQQHAQLGEPHNPCSCIGVSRKRQERYRTKQGGKDRYGCYPPWHGTVTLEILLPLHLLLREVKAGEQDCRQIYDQNNQINYCKALHVFSS